MSAPTLEQIGRVAVRFVRGMSARRGTRELVWCMLDGGDPELIVLYDSLLESVDAYGSKVDPTGGG